MDEAMKSIIGRAGEHGHWRYLLPQRFHRGDCPKIDGEWDAAERLVDGGYAEWIPSTSSLYPGIYLTKRAFEQNEPNR